MTKLPKYTLDYNEKKDRWDLENDKTDKVLKSFSIKAKATTGGVLRRILEKDGQEIAQNFNFYSK